MENDDETRLRVDFDEMARAGPRARQLIEAAYASIEGIDPARPGLVELRSSRLHPALFEMLRRCGDGRVPELLLRLVGDRCLSPAGLRHVTDLPAGHRVELLLLSPPAPERLRAALDVLAGQGVDASVAVKPGAGQWSRERLAELAGVAARSGLAPLVVRTAELDERAAADLRRSAATAPRLLSFQPDGPGGSGEPGASLLPWTTQVRLLLTDRPDERVRLSEVFEAERIPPIACTLPWRRLEIGSDGAFGPCCSDYLQTRILVDPLDPEPERLWNAEAMCAIRGALAGGAPSRTCRASCPALSAGAHRPERWVLRGGSAAVVESQIRLVEAMLAGRERLCDGPLELCVATTARCNHDCVMCCANRGPGGGEDLPAAFYARLEGILAGLLLFDANGGEPLMSSAFLGFLEGTDFSKYPQLRLHLTTNGSLLTPERLARLVRVPFSSLTISVNAASAGRYLEVNRGASWARLRANLDALHKALEPACDVRYSMVIVRSNVGEVAAFAELAAADGAGVRYLLPTRNRNGQSIMTDPELMRRALEGLGAARERISVGGRRGCDLLEMEGVMAVLRERLARGVAVPL